MTQGTQHSAEDPRNADILISINGVMKPRNEAMVSVFDSGFVLGDGGQAVGGVFVTAFHADGRGVGAGGERDEHGEINLRQLIEDELILTLPLFPMHDVANCKVDPTNMSFGDIGPEPEKPNPFAILQELKKK